MSVGSLLKFLLNSVPYKEIQDFIIKVNFKIKGSIFGTTPFGKSDSASSSLFADATPVASREGGENEEG